MKRLANDIYDMAYNSNRRLKHVSKKGLREWERTYIKRLIEVEAADGNYQVYVEELFKENVEWLRKEGFMVLGDDDTGYNISWGKVRYAYYG